MRNTLTIDGHTFYGHRYAGGAYSNTTGSLTQASPTFTHTFANSGFANIQIFMHSNGSAYVEFYMDNVYCGYMYAQTAVNGNWQTVAFPVQAGQVLRMTATGVPSGTPFWYRIQNFYWTGS